MKILLNLSTKRLTDVEDQQTGRSTGPCNFRCEI